MRSSDPCLASCSGMMASGSVSCSDGSAREDPGVRPAFDGSSEVFAVGSRFHLSPPETAVGSSLPGPLLLPSNVTYFRPVTPGWSQAWMERVLVYLMRAPDRVPRSPYTPRRSPPVCLAYAGFEMVAGGARTSDLRSRSPRQRLRQVARCCKDLSFRPNLLSYTKATKLAGARCFVPRLRSRPQ